MDLVYLDYDCFQRGFDDPRQVRIQMEALACQEIFMVILTNFHGNTTPCLRLLAIDFELVKVAVIAVEDVLSIPF